MREILFRGKRKDTGEWVEAFSILKCQVEGTWQFLVGACKNALMELDEHYNIHSAISEEDFLYYSVHPETMGQFTGLTDKNGTKIFEGDILKDDWGKIYKVFYTTKSCSFMAECTVTPNEWETGNYRIGEAWCETVRVIGNIHDNPELLVATDDEETN